MAVERVRDGERPSTVIASFGFNRTTIYRWLEAASKPGICMWGLRSRPATGRPRSLTLRQDKMLCTAELGAVRDKPLWSNGLASGNRSVRPPR